MQLISNKRMDAIQLQLKALQAGNLSNMVANFSRQIFPVWKQFNNAYEVNDMIYSVIKKLATNAAMIPFYGYAKKTGEDLPDTDKLAVFLETLDFEQKEIMYTHLWYRGEVFAYKIKIDEGVNKGLNKLMFLHPGKVTLLLSEVFPIEITGYIYREPEHGIEITIAPEEMLFIKLYNPSCNTITEWRGLSPVDVLSRALTMDSSSDDVTVAQLQNGGVPGIAFNKSTDLGVEISGSRKDNFARFLRNKDNKGAPYFADGDLGYIAIGSQLADMEVMELKKEVQKRICNAFGVSMIMFNSDSASTESNVQEMEKEMYINTIIPNVTRVEAALNKQVVPDIKTTGYIKADVSDIKALHDDEIKKASALSQKWWLTPNQRREADGYDQDANPLMDKIIVPSGFMLLDDLEMAIQPVDNTAGDYVPPTGGRAAVVPIKTGTNG